MAWPHQSHGARRKGLASDYCRRVGAKRAHSPKHAGKRCSADCSRRVSKPYWYELSVLFANRCKPKTKENWSSSLRGRSHPQIPAAGTTEQLAKNAPRPVTAIQVPAAMVTGSIPEAKATRHSSPIIMQRNEDMAGMHSRSTFFAGRTCADLNQNCFHDAQSHSILRAWGQSLYPNPKST